MFNLYKSFVFIIIIIFFLCCEKFDAEDKYLKWLKVRNWPCQFFCLFVFLYIVAMGAGPPHLCLIVQKGTASLCQNPCFIQE